MTGAKAKLNLYPSSNGKKKTQILTMIAVKRIVLDGI